MKSLLYALPIIISLATISRAAAKEKKQPVHTPEGIFSLVVDNGRYGVRDAAGTLIIPVDFDSIRYQAPQDAQVRPLYVESADTTAYYWSPASKACFWAFKKRYLSIYSLKGEKAVETFYLQSNENMPGFVFTINETGGGGYVYWEQFHPAYRAGVVNALGNDGAKIGLSATDGRLLLSPSVREVTLPLTDNPKNVIKSFFYGRSLYFDKVGSMGIWPLEQGSITIPYGTAYEVNCIPDVNNFAGVQHQMLSDEMEYYYNGKGVTGASYAHEGDSLLQNGRFKEAYSFFLKSIKEGTDPDAYLYSALTSYYVADFGTAKMIESVMQTEADKSCHYYKSAPLPDFSFSSHRKVLNFTLDDLDNYQRLNPNLDRSKQNMVRWVRRMTHSALERLNEYEPRYAAAREYVEQCPALLAQYNAEQEQIRIQREAEEQAAYFAMIDALFSHGKSMFSGSSHKKKKKSSSKGAMASTGGGSSSPSSSDDGASAQWKKNRARDVARQLEEQRERLAQAERSRENDPSSGNAALIQSCKRRIAELERELHDLGQ
ncbi:MAG: hypothetical protein LUC85_02775 [Bacteroidales bacterium]|nr:hypothetical protein [Bacteroidales bacterium]MCD8393742.1 hypothetical protein [Bacteroidales bacterium]